MEKPTATNDFAALPALQQVCSPTSSKEGTDSYYLEGTPDTRPTALSPEERSAQSNKFITTPNNLVASDSQSNRINAKSNIVFDGYQTHNKHDPFTSTEEDAPKPAQKLSATAVDFTPSLNLSTLWAPSQNNIIPINEHRDNANDVDITGRHPSTDLSVTRCLFVTQGESAMHLTESALDICIANIPQRLLPNGKFQYCRGTTTLASVHGGIFVRCTNVRDACMLATRIPSDGKWKADFKSPVVFHQITDPTQPGLSAFEGQLIVLAAQQHPFGPVLDIPRVEASIRGMFQQEGDVFAFKTEATFQDGLKALVEFSDINVALDAAEKLQGAVISGVKLEINFRSATAMSMGDDTPRMLATPVGTPMRSSVDDLASSFDTMSMGQPTPGSMFATPGAQSPSPTHMGSHFGMYPMMYHNHMVPATPLMFDPMTPRPQSIMPQTPIPQQSPMAQVGIMRPLWAPSPQMHSSQMYSNSSYMSPRSMSAFNRPDNRRASAMRVNRAPFFNPAGHHNHVDTSRIREGIDVRTTVMLRNIPNKVDQMMLKGIVDESSWGKYDFMYLRIDFANDCNVGYAFINFVDPLDIIDFVNARGNQRWNCFKSDKVAEISYATIQGKDCLVQKFRNSSVMLEAPHYRPKLFYTSNGPVPDMAGQEEPFPSPDNHSKMKRSCENAEHVGLFTPNAGQHLRDEQRRRRSQYDRGTRLAALEEYSDMGSPLGYMHMPQQ